MNEALSPQHAKAMQIVADAKENIARIRARTDLVPEAKAQQIADVYLSATGKLDPLRADYEAGETNRLARLQRKAFALPLDDSMAAASYRDALDRFGRLQDEDRGPNAEEQALIIINRAARAGDELAIRVAANVGFDRHWTKATARACELVPAIAEHVQALAEARRSRVHRRFRDDAVFGLAQPDELRHVNLNATAAKS
jgi:hypothetical protein